MLTTKSATMAALALAGVLAAGAARADVVYTFAPTSATKLNPNYPTTIASLGITLDLVNQASSFFLDSRGNAGANPTFTGDLANFISADFAGGMVTPSYLYGSVNVNLTFDGTGAVTSSSVNFEGLDTDQVVSGVGTSASGYVITDDPRCNVTGGCTVTGVWSEQTTSAVPEPATFAVLGVGLVGLAAARRRST